MKSIARLLLGLGFILGTWSSAHANGSGPYKHFQPGTRTIEGKYTVFDIPTSYAVPHCLAPDGKGNIWFVEIGANRIGRFDTKKKEFKEWAIPTPSSQPHGITADKDGNIWFTEAGVDKIGRFDPKTETFTEFPIPPGGEREGARGGVGRIHTPMMGSDGYLYATNEWIGTIVKLDPRTGQTWEFATPTRKSRPYGIQIDFEGKVWFVELGNEHVGMLDPETGKISEYKTPTPKSGPRRMTIDPQGILWYTEWNTHKIGSIDPKTLAQKEFVPPSSPQTGAYAIASDGAGVLYVAEFVSNQVSRFDPRTEKWTQWPMPLRRSRVRNIIVDEEGYVWYADNGNSKLVRLE